MARKESPRSLEIKVQCYHCAPNSCCTNIYLLLIYHYAPNHVNESENLKYTSHGINVKELEVAATASQVSLTRAPTCKPRPGGDATCKGELHKTSAPLGEGYGVTFTGIALPKSGQRSSSAKIAPCSVCRMLSSLLKKKKLVFGIIGKTHFDLSPNLCSTEEAVFKSLPEHISPNRPKVIHDSSKT